MDENEAVSGFLKQGNDRLIRVAGVAEDSIVDGPGLRMTIFVQGCDKRCEGCHNPEAQPLSGGVLYTTDELFQRIQGNPMVKGVTFSGGEPLLQAEALCVLADMVKSAGLELAVYTGDVFEDILKKGDARQLALLALADVLIDGQFILELRTLALPFRGSSNQRILDVKKSLAEKKAVILDDPAWNPLKFYKLVK
jgi:anaerobic ribonucleoside-triphosphate reductase activating protein